MNIEHTYDMETDMLLFFIDHPLQMHTVDRIMENQFLFNIKQKEMITESLEELVKKQYLINKYDGYMLNLKNENVQMILKLVSAKVSQVVKAHDI